jgi:flagellar protein FlgJ
VSSVVSQAQFSQQDVYTELSGLNAIKMKGRDDSAAGLKEVAQQFESLFIRMMLKEMRNGLQSLTEDNYLSSNEMQMYQENFDNQISLTLASGKGLGLADQLYQQLIHQYQASPPPESTGMPLPTEFSADFSDPAGFVNTMTPYAQAAAEKLGVLPAVLLAQSALETGWGQRVARDSQGASSHNLFGVKADRSWSGPVARTGTLEYSEGLARREQASFRKYESFAASFDDYVEFLSSNPRYQQALAQKADPESFVEALQDAGYATDPNYATKLKELMRSSTIREAVY